MTKLSKRERIMLYLMLMAIIVGGGSIAIRPLYKNYTNVQKEFDTITMEVQVTDLELAQLPALKANLKEEKEFYQQNKNYFTTLRTPAYIEPTICKVLEDCNLEPVGTIIELITQAAEEDYSQEYAPIEGDSSTMAELEEFQMTGEDGEEIETSMPTMNSNMYDTAVFTIECKGTFKNFSQFLNHAKKSTDLKINSYSSYNESGDLSFDLNRDEIYTYYIRLTYYMQPTEDPIPVD